VSPEPVISLSELDTTEIDIVLGRTDTVERVHELMDSHQLSPDARPTAYQTVGSRSRGIGQWKAQRKGVAMTDQSRQTSTGAKLTFGITRGPVESEGFPVAHQQLFTMDLAAAGPIGAAQMSKALADAEIVTSYFRDYPKDMADIFNHVVAGRTKEANDIAVRLGLSEQSFLEQGGGMWMYIALAGAVIFAYAAFS
jgi:hypothetical protein